MELNDQQKEDARLKAQQYADLMGEAYVDPFPEEQPDPTKVNQPVPVDELTTEQLLEAINKRKGLNLTSLDALEALKPQPTEADIAAEAEKRKTEMHVYGLTSGKFTQDEWDSYQSTLANKKDLVRSEVSAQLKTAFPELADDAIEEKVANYLFEHLEETDPLRIAREKEIMTLSDIKIKDKFKNIVNLPADYENHVGEATSKANFERKKQATIPVYTADVKTALQSLKQFSVEIPDTKNPANTVTVQLEFADNDLKEMEDLLLTDAQINRATKEGLTIEQIKGETELVLVQKHLKRLISQAAKQYNATQKEGYINGRKGGITSNLGAIDVHDDNQHNELEKVYDELVESAKQG